jgi:acyl-CoA synthetase (AMP-forming)/AMP-acid ligase II
VERSPFAAPVLAAGVEAATDRGPVRTESELDRFTTLVDLLDERAAAHGDQTAFRFLSASGDETAALTFAETVGRARAIAERLRAEGQQGASALLLFPPGPDFVCAFLGCIAAGTVAVPVYPPDPTRFDQTLVPLRTIVSDAGPGAVLTDALLIGLRDPLSAEIPELRRVPWIGTATIDASGAERWDRPWLDSRFLALLQYTSGSTSAPKGVMVTHANLLANLRQQAGWLGLRDDMRLWSGERFRSICWLPFYHDMGLISGILLTLHCAGETTFISPIDFVRRPLLWLQAISRQRANFAGGPDFAYALCARRSTAEERAELDLSSWKVAFSGAEPVRAKTLATFSSTFAGAGFRPETFAPCYGLAEATLLVTMVPRRSGATVAELDTEKLEHGIAAPATAESARCTSLASCGPPVAGVDVRIVDPDACRPLPEGRVGEVWIRGPNVTAGYWNAPEATAACFDWELPGGEAGFLRTGDLGFVHGGELYLTSRRKDLIIVRGRNHSPADIEQSVEYAHTDIRPGSGAAFAVDREAGEQLVVVAELRKPGAAPDLAALFESVSTAVFERHGIAIEQLALVAPRTVPRTSSGKVQRHAARAGYLNGTLAAVATLDRCSGAALSGAS